MTPTEVLSDSLAGLSGPLGLAVSGGSDSLALLYLVADWGRSHGVTLFVATVNHGLRPEAEEECDAVAAQCAKLAIPHETLHWSWDGTGNLQASARAGRYDALSAWARENGLEAVAVGHTQDDVAETFLMRLARGSGVTGLARMQSAWHERGVTWVRPLLNISRAALRDELTKRGAIWSDDKSNSDFRYDRVKARAAFEALEPLGITRETLADTAERLSSARDALDWLLRDVAAKAVLIEGADVTLNLDELLKAPEETQQRLFGEVIGWVGQTAYPPRRQLVRNALEAARQQRKATLNGCVVLSAARRIRVVRELAAVSKLKTASTAVWDGRFAFDGPHAAHLTIAALAEAGLKQCSDWRETGIPRASLLASPAVWEGDALVAAPMAGLSNGWTVRLVETPAFLKS